MRGFVWCFAFGERKSMKEMERQALARLRLQRDLLDKVIADLRRLLEMRREKAQIRRAS